MSSQFSLYKRESKFFIFVILALLTFNLVVTNQHTIGSVDSLTSPVLLAAQHQFYILGVEQAKKINRFKYSFVASFGLILLYNQSLIQSNIFASYELACISKLFLVLQRLLLPRNNSSKYKAPLVHL